ncbi:response regulator transcription factor [Aequorivita sp. H23M31]|uniref:Response regulator transcription factor n=1 Tax=Aequorivita ciconiae TaxID=2494375 RepID=A0A410G2M8_9FLAO|nr:response regulator [Aequorivita sp. H23M31]QAA81499.1 response regulator transcription factor [Aequorivita sp. H23M31]
MENKNISVLLIDDHPLILDAYRTAFDYYSTQNSSISFSIYTAEDCDEGIKMINSFSSEKKILDIVFLDIMLPSSKDGKILSGEDLGLIIRKLLPNTKIIVATTLNDNYRVHSIFKSLDPDGFLIKNDINAKELIETIDVLLNDPPYYSRTVLKLLRKHVANDFLLDNIDRRILYELSIGTKMKDLPDILPLSIAGIEKRKRQLKHIFNMDSLDDRELLAIARNKGFI